MMRVPVDPERPTYDNTFKVGFWRWLTSSAADRKEWARRRNAATAASADRPIQHLREKQQQAQQDLAQAQEGLEQSKQDLADWWQEREAIKQEIKQAPRRTRAAWKQAKADRKQQQRKEREQ